ncbi:LysR family transcriptional regulator [Marinobacterium aestuariivivens]|uniref:LysR family transcriptional regulator n=1 Tax=Marinobacterium aestuariivivens TaxID=1698799 RepID=A0ABW1ZVX7_9GAMM
MSAVTFKQLRVFASVARQGSLARAAEELHLTRAAVSMALQELERQLDTRLFDRIRNRLVLNPAGEQLVPWPTNCWSGWRGLPGCSAPRDR